jgi:hypothetical protein
MKDAIVEEIHRYRAEQARRFNYDVHAIGADIRRREVETQGRLMGLDSKHERLVEAKKPTALRRKKLGADTIT